MMSSCCLSYSAAAIFRIPWPSLRPLPVPSLLRWSAPPSRWRSTAGVSMSSDSKVGAAAIMGGEGKNGAPLAGESLQPPVSLPDPPEKPEPGDCCGSGCVRCVWDVYYEELEEYNKKLDAIKGAADDAKRSG